MFLESAWPMFPTNIVEILVYVSGMVGTILMAYSVFVEAEFRSDLMRFVGALCLLVYTLFIGNMFLTITFAAIGLASMIEAIEIRLGLLKNPEARH